MVVLSFPIVIKPLNVQVALLASSCLHLKTFLPQESGIKRPECPTQEHFCPQDDTVLHTYNFLV